MLRGKVVEEGDLEQVIKEAMKVCYLLDLFVFMCVCVCVCVCPHPCMEAGIPISVLIITPLYSMVRQNSLTRNIKMNSGSS